MVMREDIRRGVDWRSEYIIGWQHTHARACAGLMLIINKPVNLRGAPTI